MSKMVEEAKYSNAESNEEIISNEEEVEPQEEITSSKKNKKRKQETVQDFYIKKINSLESELNKYKEREQTFKDELNKKYLEAIQKKSEEASLLIKEREKQVEEKYSLKFEENKKFIYENQFAELVNIISGLEKVIYAEAKSEEVKNYLLGFKMFLTQFEALLDSLNIKSISPKINEEFDSEKMESLETVEVEQNKKNKIIEVFSKGYTLNERVIKLAQVKVGI
ncbi:nucleotide exchange factor GrpE [Mycoplasma parvum]|uniref:Protein GrpE n=1 Tax=Mycoplasma parvum str. Indiana TaxID=1403316 RepID=U5NCA3_9MOLU|nr:nucleotide exchange factor GrpE [Mycoplasma parvum]AGX89052.1 hypothetical protein PRV_01465 [Mycoplasma parvum str. Indiana]